MDDPDFDTFEWHGPPNGCERSNPYLSVQYAKGPWYLRVRQAYRLRRVCFHTPFEAVWRVAIGPERFLGLLAIAVVIGVLIALVVLA